MDAKEKWNRKYRKRLEDGKEITANERLRIVLPQVAVGAALDLACGLGGNSLLLAENGFEVHSYDVSEVAISQLKLQARVNNLPVHAEVCDLSNVNGLQLRGQPFDLVVMTYYLDRQLFPLIKDIVKENGYFFMETFFHSPVNEDISDVFKLNSQELRKEFADWTILYFEENSLEGRQTIFCQKI